MSGTSPARFPYFLLTLLSAFLGAALMYGLIAGRVPGTLAVKAEPAASHGSVVDLQNAIVHAAEVIAPSVVNIDTVGEGQSGVPDLFGRGPARKGQGSGVIVSADGYILTNDHVVDGAAVINVTFNDKRQLKATLQGADKLSDIAIVKVDARDLPAATLGDSDRIPIGAFLIAVGSPLGYQHTVTLGVLSGRGREVPEPGKEFRDLLQTDAAINPGNSGGPLVDIEGHVIGINTAIIPQAQGIGFAIPINSARDTMKQLIATGKVVRPYIGVVMQPVTEEVASVMHLPKVEGILVRQVVPDSPAAAAGIARGDVILEVDGSSVSEPTEVQKRIRSHRIGDRIALKVWSGSHLKTISLAVAEMPNLDLTH